MNLDLLQEFKYRYDQILVEIKVVMGHFWRQPKCCEALALVMQFLSVAIRDQWVFLAVDDECRRGHARHQLLVVEVLGHEIAEKLHFVFHYVLYRSIRRHQNQCSWLVMSCYVDGWTGAYRSPEDHYIFFLESRLLQHVLVYVSAVFRDPFGSAASVFFVYTIPRVFHSKNANFE